MKIVYTLDKIPNKINKSIFLAGPSMRDTNVGSWRKKALEILKKLGYDGVVFVPEYADDSAYEVEYRIRHKDGSIRYFLERGRVRNPLNGQTPFVDSVILDITERKSSEEKLERAYLKLMERQSFIESILSNIQSGIIVTDQGFQVMLINPSGEKFLNVSSEAVTGKNLEVVCPTFADALKGDGDLDEIHCTACAREHVIGFKMFDMKGKDDAVDGHIISFVKWLHFLRQGDKQWTDLS